WHCRGPFYGQRDGNTLSDRFATNSANDLSVFGRCRVWAWHLAGGGDFASAKSEPSFAAGSDARRAARGNRRRTGLANLVRCRARSGGSNSDDAQHHGLDFDAALSVVGVPDARRFGTIDARGVTATLGGADVCLATVYVCGRKAGSIAAAASSIANDA